MKVEIIIMSFIVTTLFTTNTTAQVDPKSIKLAHKYIAAKPVKRGPPIYPSPEYKRSNEGWVDLIFTVTKEGEVNDVQLVGHSGVKGFVRPAIKAAAKYEYEPAMLNGQPVDSVQEIRILFMMSSTPRGADRAFVRTFKKFREAITSRNESEASQHITRLRELKSNNLYENAYLNLAEYYFGLLTDAKSEFLLGRLIAATRVDGARPYIANEAWIIAMRSRFMQQVKLARYGAALNTFAKIPEKKRYDELRSELAPIVTQINEIKTNDKHFATAIELGRYGFAGVNLIKPVFSVSNLKGEIENFRLTCDSGIYGLTFTTDVEYQVPRSYGDCHLRIRGAANTSFKLVQLPIANAQQDS